MHKVVQNVRTGETRVAAAPDPVPGRGQVLIANAASVVSAGTEKMVLELSRRSLVGKALERPAEVRRVLAKLRAEGLLATARQVLDRLDEPLALGYSSAGTVLGCGPGVHDLRPGDRVASNGPHADLVVVPRNLCARVPDGVALEQAAFAVLGAIALQGVRLAHAAIGETALVVGLGLVGQIAVALLRAAGCRVLGTDPDAGRCELARRMGAEQAAPGLDAGAVSARTLGLGADFVIVAASTPASGPMALAVEAVRPKGRIVVVGAVGLELDRRPLYFKEAEVVVSCSYGPGRYDPEYEERGRDYPAAHVRWTEQRNIAAVLELMGRGALDLAPLVTHRFDLGSAGDAYRLLTEGREPYLGVVIRYPEAGERAPVPVLPLAAAPSRAPGRIGLGTLGAGGFARSLLLPEARRTGAFRLRVAASAGGTSAAHAAGRLGFERAAAGEDEVLSDPEVEAVLVLTRHDRHAGQAVRALRAGKHVWVEKPLALTLGEIDEVEAALAALGAAAPLLAVGFNRRFSPAARAVRRFVADLGAPLAVSIRFNAGALPASHWTQDDEVGGGRLVGEACHAIDLATYLTGELPVRVFAESVGGPAAPRPADDQAFLTLRHAGGSVTSIGYLAGGDRGFPKERIEVLGGGRMAVIDDFREAHGSRGGRVRRLGRWARDKGHRAALEAFAAAIRTGGPAPVPWPELRAVSRAAVLAVASLGEGIPLEV